MSLDTMRKSQEKNVMLSRSKSHGLNDEVIKSGIAYGQNCKWFMFNYSKFKEQCRGRFVAVFDKKIIDSDIHFETLMNRLSKMKIDANAVFTMYVPEDSAYLIRITKRS